MNVNKCDPNTQVNGVPVEKWLAAQEPARIPWQLVFSATAAVIAAARLIQMYVR